MVSYADLDPDAPFAVVFSSRGMDWAAKLVAVGALFGGCDGVHGGVSRREQAGVCERCGRCGSCPAKLVAFGALLGGCDAGQGWVGR